jgi:DHA1 family multidrug resistance protein-like MFS transporter
MGRHPGSAHGEQGALILEVWRKNLFVLWGTQFLAMLGMNLVVPFLPFFVRELGVLTDPDVAFWSGAAFAGTFLSAFVATPFWGTLGDRYGRKAMVVRAIFGLALSQVFIGLSQNVYQLVAFRLLQGAISGFIASSLALVSTNTPKDKIGYALGVLQSSTASGMVLGPFVGGLLADVIGYRPIFFITAVLCAIGGFLVALLVRETTPRRPDGVRDTVGDNIRLMFANRQLRIAGLSLVAAQAAVLMIEPVFALFIESFDTETEYLSTLTGAIFSIAGIFMIVSAPWWGKRSDRSGQKKNLILALGSVSAVYAGHALATNLFQLGILRAFLGFARGAILPGLYAIVNIHAPTDRRGGMMAIAASFTLLGNTIGPLLGGIVAGRLGVRTAFIAASCILMALSIFIWKEMSDSPEAGAQTAQSTSQPC